MELIENLKCIKLEDALEKLLENHDFLLKNNNDLHYENRNLNADILRLKEKNKVLRSDASLNNFDRLRIEYDEFKTKSLADNYALQNRYNIILRLLDDEYKKYTEIELDDITKVSDMRNAYRKLMSDYDCLNISYFHFVIQHKMLQESYDKLNGIK